MAPNMSVPTDDPYAQADVAEPTPPADRMYFGEVTLCRAWFCALIKGQGKVPYDAKAHADRKRNTAIDLLLSPIGASYQQERQYLDWDKGWAIVVAPSLRRLGVSTRDLEGRWASWKMTRSGRTWKNDEDETVYEVAPEFQAIYPDQAACDAARIEHYGPDDDDEDETPAGGYRNIPQPISEADLAAPAAPVAAAPAKADPRRAQAAQNLPLLWMAAGNDKARFLAILAGDPLCGSLFDENSPEVKAITG